MRISIIATIIFSALSFPLAAQTTPTIPPSSSTAPTLKPTAAKMTADQAMGWRDKPVFSSDNKKIGEVKTFSRSGDDTVIDLQADIGGFMGIGERRIRLMPSQFELEADRVVLKLTAEQAKAVPKIQK